MTFWDPSICRCAGHGAEVSFLTDLAIFTTWIAGIQGWTSWLGIDPQYWPSASALHSLPQWLLTINSIPHWPGQLKTKCVDTEGELDQYRADLLCIHTGFRR